MKYFVFFAAVLVCGCEHLETLHVSVTLSPTLSLTEGAGGSASVAVKK